MPDQPSPALLEEEVSERLGAMCARLLNRRSLRRDVPFAEVGGDSLFLLALLTEVEDQFGVFLEAQDVLDDLTVNGVSRAVVRAAG